MTVVIGAVLIDIFMVIAVVVGLLAIAMLVRALLTDFRSRPGDRVGRAPNAARVGSAVFGGESRENQARRAAAGSGRFSRLSGGANAASRRDGRRARARKEEQVRNDLQ